MYASGYDHPLTDMQHRIPHPSQPSPFESRLCPYYIPSHSMMTTRPCCMYTSRSSGFGEGGPTRDVQDRPPKSPPFVLDGVEGAGSTLPSAHLPPLGGGSISSPTS